MAYTICDNYGQPKPIRLILKNAQEDKPYLGKEFTPYWWACDPCARPAERFQVEHRCDQAKPTGYAWYQVITSDDEQKDIEFKLEHYGKVIAARKAADVALAEYKRLNGC
jgi:hypothetical protein